MYSSKFYKSPLPVFDATLALSYFHIRKFAFKIRKKSSNVVWIEVSRHCTLICIEESSARGVFTKTCFEKPTAVDFFAQ